MDILKSTFPFGKYKGTELVQLPSTYITFALETFNLSDDIMDALRVILMYKTGMIDFIMNDVIGRKKWSNESTEEVIIGFADYYSGSVRLAMKSKEEHEVLLQKSQNA